MSNAWPLVPLGELLVRSAKIVEIVPTEVYKEVTIRLWGKGVVLRGETPGQEIAATRRFGVKAGQFILSRIDARNGALGIVPDFLDRAVASNDFPAYDSWSEMDALGHVAFSLPFPAACSKRVGDYVAILSGYAFKSEWFSDDGVRLARNVNVGHGRLDWSDTARLPREMCRSFSRFELKEGDILISLDRPIIATGVKVARVARHDLPCFLLQRVAKVCFPDDSVLSDYMFAWLRSVHFTGAIDPGRSNGVPHISPNDITHIPFDPPPLPEQRRIVAYLDGLKAKADCLKALQDQTQAELDALLPSILDKAFKGEL